ncbi:unnamed protein product [Calypogeia fissa]
MNATMNWKTISKFGELPGIDIDLRFAEENPSWCAIILRSGANRRRDFVKCNPVRNVGYLSRKERTIKDRRLQQHLHDDPVGDAKRVQGPVRVGEQLGERDPDANRMSNGESEINRPNFTSIISFAYGSTSTALMLTRYTPRQHEDSAMPISRFTRNYDDKNSTIFHHLASFTSQYCNPTTAYIIHAPQQHEDSVMPICLSTRDNDDENQSIWY